LLNPIQQQYFTSVYDVAQYSPHTDIHVVIAFRHVRYTRTVFGNPFQSHYGFQCDVPVKH